MVKKEIVVEENVQLALPVMDNDPATVAYESKRVEYKKICRQISASMKSIEISIVKVARSLTCVKENRLYELDNYQNVYDFAKDKFGISKSTCSRYLGLIEFFGVDSNLSATQMIELLPYVRKGGNISEITPDMSTRQIRQYIKEHKLVSSCGAATDAAIEGPVRDVKPKSFVFNITDDLFAGPCRAYEAFFADIQTAVINAHKKYGAKSIKIVIE
ncbi:MAG: hypothetical protein HFI33_01220 [Lachnospiraceae bacterium]|jgi:hypothetical protein|nr:hypothetical protein [Lachnospiraceae bacterium]